MAAMGLRLPTTKGSCRSGFMGSQVVPLRSQSRAVVGQKRLAARAAATQQNQDWLQGWLRKDPYVLMVAFAGWTIPASTPIPGPNNPNGDSLFFNFLGSIGRNLAQFPKPPALDDPFWVYLAVYHLGLFIALTLGQIGWQGRKQGYFD